MERRLGLVWARARELIRSSVARPGTLRFALGTLIVCPWIFRLAIGMGEVPIDVMGDVQDSPIGRIHPFASDIVFVMVTIAAAWLIRGISPGTGWLLLLFSLAHLNDDMWTLASGELLTDVWLASLPAGLAMIAALYATDPVRRLGRWIVPLTAGLLAWNWLGTGLLLNLPSIDDQLSPWILQASLNARDWMPGVIVAIGLLGEVHRRFRLRAWVSAVDARLRGGPGAPLPPRRWLRAALILGFGLLAASIPAVMSEYFDSTFPLFLVATALLLAALVLRHFARPVAWLALWAGAFISLNATATLAGPETDANMAFIRAAYFFAAYGAFVAMGTLYAAEPGRRIGRWVLPVGIGAADRRLVILDAHGPTGLSGYIEMARIAR